jgi:hypothetical protein
MPEFKNKKEYEKWKGERIKASQVKPTEKIQEIPINQVNPPLKNVVQASEPIKRKKCLHCAVMIPKEAFICTYCKKKQVGWHLISKILLASFIMILVIPFFVGIINKKSSPDPHVYMLDQNEELRIKSRVHAMAFTFAYMKGLELAKLTKEEKIGYEPEMVLTQPSLKSFINIFSDKIVKEFGESYKVDAERGFRDGFMAGYKDGYK